MRKVNLEIPREMEHEFQQGEDITGIPKEVCVNRMARSAHVRRFVRSLCSTFETQPDMDRLTGRGKGRHYQSRGDRRKPPIRTQKNL